MKSSRRDFLRTAAAAGAGALLNGSVSPGILHAQPPAASGPLVISSANGLEAVKKAMEIIAAGNDALDGVIAGINIVENDPDDMSVGYGGLPNADGVVELDAAVMHGPSYRAGAVGALRNIKNPSQVARVVMERSDHVLLVGEGALRFAKAHGFKEENLLTDKAREVWLHWRETMTNQDDWLPAHSIDDKSIGPLIEQNVRHHGTIHCSAIDRRGNISCTTTTSGLAFKIPGRVGDSPIVGAGLYCDNEVGSAGSTGRGEANILICGSGMIVEWMRQGKSPQEACLAACKRIVDHTREARLKFDDGLPNFNVSYYALAKNGTYGGAAIYSGQKMAVHDGKEATLVPMAYLYET
ncbi:MAG: N(4)-(beta-N-acetylglucosaminyl)-L-asparaginase [Bacteroidota bacterium]